MVGDVNDWDRFIVMPEEYYVNLFPNPKTPKDCRCHEFALMCDHVVRYWLKVDCNCTLLTIPRNVLVLRTAVASLNQMPAVSKIKCPDLEPFTGKDEDWPTWKDKCELTFNGLGLMWITGGVNATVPSVNLNRKIGAILAECVYGTMVQSICKVIQVSTDDLLATHVWAGLVERFDHSLIIKRRHMALKKVLDQEKIQKGNLVRDSNKFLCCAADLLILERDNGLSRTSEDSVVTEFEGKIQQEAVLYAAVQKSSVKDMVSLSTAIMRHTITSQDADSKVYQQSPLKLLYCSDSPCRFC